MKDTTYWQRLKEWALPHSDGCTGVPDFHVECCWEHDYHFRKGTTLDGEPITFAEANAEFRRCIQSRSRLGRFSPMSWWRWVGVTVGGRAKWDEYRQKEQN